MGAALTPEMFRGTAELFSSIALRASATFCRVERDLAYGGHDRHRLDIYLPNDLQPNAPVIVYVHGGGFIQGDKGASNISFYGNIGAWAASLGMVGITMNYRLAPSHQWPAGAEDIASALTWIAANAAAKGFSAANLFLMGQSAGAAHVASYVSMPRLHPETVPLAGAIMLSGIYDISRLEHSPFETAYYGVDPSRFESQSSLSGLIAGDVPCVFTVAEYDGVDFQRQAALVVESWMATRGCWPRMLYLQDANHMSAALGLGCEGDLLSAELAAFIGKFRILGACDSEAAEGG